MILKYILLFILFSLYACLLFSYCRIRINNLYFSSLFKAMYYISMLSTYFFILYIYIIYQNLIFLVSFFLLIFLHLLITLYIKLKY